MRLIVRMSLLPNERLVIIERSDGDQEAGVDCDWLVCYIDNSDDFAGIEIMESYGVLAFDTITEAEIAFTNYSRER